MADHRIPFETSSSMVVFEDSDFPMRDSDDEIIGELSQDFVEASQFFSDLTHRNFSQVGSGNETHSHSSNISSSLIGDIPNVSGNLDDCIIIEEKNRRKNKKYQGEEVSFRIRIDGDRLPQHLAGHPLMAAEASVQQLFDILLKRCTQNLQPSDLIRVFIQTPGLNKPISTNLMPVISLTVEKILSTVMKVLQSKDEIQLDSGFTADIITIRRDIGAGRHRRVINVEIDRLQKRSVISVPPDDEGLCCAKAIIFALAYLNNDKSAIDALRDQRRPALTKRAQELHQEAKVPLGPCTYTEICEFEKHLDVQMVVISSENLNRVSYKGPNKSKRINLWLHANHYDVIKCLKGFYASNFYCETCEKPYQNLEDHHCSMTCSICQRTDCKPEESRRCMDCDRLCQSTSCFTSHKATNGKQELSLCDRMYQCRFCCKIILRRHCPREKHRCGTTKCPSCKQFVDAKEHRCYLYSISAKTPSDHLIFFDFETDQSTGEHLVNFAVAQYADGTEKIFSGYSACERFCSWLFAPKHKGYTAIAHNMKGFDGQFVMAWLLNQGATTEIIPCGSKVMSIHHQTLNIRIIDSFNFLPMALSKLPACFGLEELKKGQFPHIFNTRENQDYVGILPEVKYYCPDVMSTAMRSSFLAWHKEHERDDFNFQEEILTYCRSDVDILRRCCLEFRQQFIEVAGVDPFCYVTIASACMAVYRSKHIKDKTIAMVPVHGYINNTNYSTDAIRWLDFSAKTDDIFIQHALNGMGEKKICNISVDGYCASTNTIYQYHGCFFHGCPNCYDRDNTNPLIGTTMGCLYQKTEETTRKLRVEGYHVIEIWEHDFYKMKKEDENLIQFLASHELQDRLIPRNAFFGGRTNAVKLYYEGIAKYVDFTSLYPWVNKYCKYPVGYPQIITEKFGDLENYFGFMKCRVLPPRELYLPVLPFRCQEKLMFPLCRRCAESKQQKPCKHSDNERSLTGTWVTEEIN